MAQEDDLRALGKIMDFLRAVSIILAIMNVYWYCYEAMRMWGVTIGWLTESLSTSPEQVVYFILSSIPSCFRFCSWHSHVWEPRA